MDRKKLQTIGIGKAKSTGLDDVCRRFDIPAEVRDSLRNYGLKSLYEWQVRCLEETEVIKGRQNLVYCAPTGGGKSLIAELAMLKTAMVSKRKCLYILPYVSLVLEKEKHMRRMVTVYNRNRPKFERIKVTALYGDLTLSNSSIVDSHIVVCTIEKANFIANSLISMKIQGSLGCVVIDEFHSLGQEFNGFLIEVLLTKLRFLQSLADRNQNQNNQSQYNAQPGNSSHTQIIALSATIGNVRFLADWLQARLYITDFRPVPLTESIVFGTTVLDKGGNFVRELGTPVTIATTNGSGPKDGHSCSTPFSSSNKKIQNNTNNKNNKADTRGRLQVAPALQSLPVLSPRDQRDQMLLSLCLEAQGAGRQVLVFCPSKAVCEQACAMLERLLPLEKDLFFTRSKNKRRHDGNNSQRHGRWASNVNDGRGGENFEGKEEGEAEAEGEGIGSGEGCLWTDLQEEAIVDVKMAFEQLQEARNDNAAEVEKILYPNGYKGHNGYNEHNGHNNIEEAAETAESPLAAGIRKGVAYHHAGLGSAERVAVEKAFRSRCLRVLCCTSTLAAGVNLPAHTVVVLSLIVGNQQNLSLVAYRQMAGRAGRPGADKLEGSALPRLLISNRPQQAQAYLLAAQGVQPDSILAKNERIRALKLLNDKLPDVFSQMHPSCDGGNGLIRALVELFGLGLCESSEDCEAYVRKTLMFAEKVDRSVERGERNERSVGGIGSKKRALSLGSTPDDETEESKNADKANEADEANMAIDTNKAAGMVLEDTLSCVQHLLDTSILETPSPPAEKEKSTLLVLTRFGHAVMQSGLPCDEAIALYECLLRARDCLHLDTSLQVFSLMAPLKIPFSPPDFKMFLNALEGLLSDEEAQRSAASSSHTPPERKQALESRQLGLVLRAAGVEISILDRWARMPPTKYMCDTCHAKLSKLRLRTHQTDTFRSAPQALLENTNGQRQSRPLTEPEWLALGQCKRIWAACVLCRLTEGSLEAASSLAQVPIKDVLALKRDAHATAGRVQRFCHEIGWRVLERLVADVRPLLSEGGSISLQALLDGCGVHMRIKVARVLVENGITTPTALITRKGGAAALAQMIQLSIGWEVVLQEKDLPDSQSETAAAAGSQTSDPNLTPLLELELEQDQSEATTDIYKEKQIPKQIQLNQTGGQQLTKHEHTMQRLLAYSSRLLQDTRAEVAHAQAGADRRAAAALAELEAISFGERRRERESRSGNAKAKSGSNTGKIWSDDESESNDSDYSEDYDSDVDGSGSNPLGNADVRDFGAVGIAGAGGGDGESQELGREEEANRVLREADRHAVLQDNVNVYPPGEQEGFAGGAWMLSQLQDSQGPADVRGWMSLASVVSDPEVDEEAEIGEIGGIAGVAIASSFPSQGSLPYSSPSNTPTGLRPFVPNLLKAPVIASMPPTSPLQQPINPVGGSKMDVCVEDGTTKTKIAKKIEFGSEVEVETEVEKETEMEFSMWGSSTEEHEEAFARLQSSARTEDAGFRMLDVRGGHGAHLSALQALADTTEPLCVSFELLYRRLHPSFLDRQLHLPGKEEERPTPSPTSGGAAGGTSIGIMGDVSGSMSMSGTGAEELGWAGLVALAAPAHCDNDGPLSLLSVQNEQAAAARKALVEPHVLAGSQSRMTMTASSSRTTRNGSTPPKPVPDLSGLCDAAPACVRLVCEFVGFGHVQDNLEPVAAKAATVASAIGRFTNPLYCVSRAVMRLYRLSLREWWKEHVPVCWRLLREIMQNERIAKVAADIKTAVVTLRERNVLLKGAVHDPCLAAKLLELDEGDERVKVIIPTLDYNDPRTSARHPHLRRAARTASFRAISCLRAVAVLERALLEKGKGKGRQRAKHGIKALASDCENVDPASVCPEEGDEVAIANSKAMAKANINYMANAEEDRGSDSDLELRAEESEKDSFLNCLLFPEADVAWAYRAVELPAAVALAEPQFWGLPTDPGFLTRLLANLNDRLRLVEKYLLTSEGRSFNLLAPMDVRSLRSKLLQRHRPALLAAYFAERAVFRMRDKPVAASVANGINFTGTGAGNEGNGKVVGDSPHSKIGAEGAEGVGGTGGADILNTSIGSITGTGTGVGTGTGTVEFSSHWHPQSAESFTGADGGGSGFKTRHTTRPEVSDAALLPLLVTHPLLQLVAEFRSVNGCKHTCAAVLQHCFLGRARAYFNPLGTETGRVTVVSPPLQHVPKELRYVPCQSLSLHEELGPLHVPATSRASVLKDLNDRANQEGQSMTVRYCLPKSPNPLHLQMGKEKEKEEYKGGGIEQMEGRLAAVDDASYHSYAAHAQGKLRSITELSSFRNISSMPSLALGANKSGSSSSSSKNKQNRTTSAADPLPASVVLKRMEGGVIMTTADLVWRDDSTKMAQPREIAIYNAALEISWTPPATTTALNLQRFLGDVGGVRDITANNTDRMSRNGGAANTSVSGAANAIERGGESYRGQLYPDKQKSAESGPAVGAGITNFLPAPLPQPARTTARPRDAIRARSGCVLLSADYRQFELRLLAHFSGDEGLLAAFGVDSEVVPLEPTTTSKTGKPPQSQQTKQTKQTKHGKGDGGAKTAGGVDVFRRLAARWCDKPLGLVTSYERNAVKQMCYAVLFGAGPALLAQYSGLTVLAAKALLEDFLRHHARLSDFMQATRDRCRELGFVRTLAGRQRFLGLPPSTSRIKSPRVSRKEISRMGRQAVSSLTQGSAADVIKLATVRVLRLLSALDHRGLNESSTHGPLKGPAADAAGLGARQEALRTVGQPEAARLVLQVHDELVFEVREDMLAEVCACVRSGMEGAVSLRVPLEVSLRTGKSWGDLG